jgi:AAA domain
MSAIIVPQTVTPRQSEQPEVSLTGLEGRELRSREWDEAFRFACKDRGIVDLEDSGIALSTMQALIGLGVDRREESAPVLHLKSETYEDLTRAGQDSVFSVIAAGVESVLGEDASFEVHSPYGSITRDLAMELGLVPRVFTAENLMKKKIEPLRWVVNGFVPEGLTLLAAKPKTGKSWLCIDIAVAVASGSVAMGVKRVAAGDVLYLALEDGERRLQDRIGQVLQGGPSPRRLEIATRWPKLDESGLEELEGWLDRHPDARLIIIDTLQRVRQVPRSRNVYKEDYEALQGLASMSHHRRIAIIVVHHARKAEAEDPLDTISGSTGLSAAADGALVMKRRRGANEATLSVVNRDSVDQELAIQFDRTSCTWRILGRADEHQESATRLEIKSLLEAADETMSPKEIAEALGRNPATTRVMLPKMLADGEIARPKKGQYCPVNTVNGVNSDNHVGPTEENESCVKG